MKKDSEQAARDRLGLALRQARHKKELSQEVVGARYGVGKGAVSAWETGRSDPGAVKLGDLATLYGVTTDSLLFESAPSPEAMQLAAEFDQLAEKDRSTLRALWEAYVAQVRG